MIVGLEQERRRRLGPHDQVGAALRRVRGFILVNSITLRQELRIPLERLRNISLHHRDLEASRSRRVFQITDSPRAKRDQRDHHSGQHAQADGLQAIGAAAKNHDVHDGVEKHDQRRDAVNAGEFGELDQFKISIRRVTEQVPWERGGDIRTKPLERRPRNRHRDHRRNSQPSRDQFTRPDRNRRVDRDDCRQRQHREDRELHRHVGEVVQRNRNPVELHDVRGEALQVGPAEYAPHALAFDHVKQRHQRHPRQQSEVELRKCQPQRETAGYGERRARCVVRRHRQAGEPNISARGITPAHGGRPLKRSKISSTSFQVSTSAAVSGGSNLKIAGGAPFALEAPIDRRSLVDLKRHHAPTFFRRENFLRLAPWQINHRSRTHSESIAFVDGDPEWFIAAPIAPVEYRAQLGDRHVEHANRGMRAADHASAAANHAILENRHEVVQRSRGGRGAREMRQHRNCGNLCELAAHREQSPPFSSIFAASFRSRANIRRASAAERSWS